ncbi:MAG: orotate phosphoribosyltransferase [Nanoarchaeota archaeon]|nr:orotate phosphoribosyltransferase [Nanoarchaeota archaeon]
MCIIEDNKVRVAKILLSLKCVDINFNNLFTYASGKKSPIYTNCRLIISYPKERDEISGFLSKAIKEKVTDISTDTMICGMASAGIPHSSWVAERLNLGMVYARQERKDHGLKKIIEGKEIDTLPVIIVEDHITTAGSLADEVKELRKEGAEVKYAFSIFTYNLQKAKDAIKDMDIQLFSLCDIDTLLDVAVQDGQINLQQKDEVLKILNS